MQIIKIKYVNVPKPSSDFLFLLTQKHRYTTSIPNAQNFESAYSMGRKPSEYTRSLMTDRPMKNEETPTMLMNNIGGIINIKATTFVLKSIFSGNSLFTRELFTLLFLYAIEYPINKNTLNKHVR